MVEVECSLFLLLVKEGLSLDELHTKLDDSCGFVICHSSVLFKAHLCDKAVTKSASPVSTMVRINPKRQNPKL